MCKNAVEAGPYQLKDVPDWFVTQKHIKIWHDDDDKITKWYDGYKK